MILTFCIGQKKKAIEYINHNDVDAETYDATKQINKTTMIKKYNIYTN